MKLNEILAENVMWTDELSRLVDLAVHYHAQNPKDEAAHILRNYIAPMLSHAHDHPADIEDPEAFKTAVNIVRSSFPNPVADHLQNAIRELHTAMPHYHGSDPGL